MYVRTGLANRTYAAYSDSGYTWPFDTMTPALVFNQVPALKIVMGSVGAYDWSRQDVSIPGSATSATLSFWWRMASNETGSGYDWFRMEIRNTSDVTQATVVNNQWNNSDTWTQVTYNMSAYIGLTVRLWFAQYSNTSINTWTWVDDVSLNCDVSSNSFPYETAVETSTGWTHGAIAGTDEWENGVPNYTGITSDHTRGTNTNAWGTDLDNTYEINTDQWLKSPSISIPSWIQPPTLTFWHWYNIGTGDSAYVEISQDNSTWYTFTGGTYGAGSSGGWLRASFDLASAPTIGDCRGKTIWIRFRLSSDGATVGPGWYVDDFKIGYGIVTREVHTYGGAQTFDNFSDGDYTANPLWTVVAGTWNATNGYLETTNSTSTDFTIYALSTQAYGAWEMRFRHESNSTNNCVIRWYFMYGGNPDPANALATGYYLFSNTANSNFKLIRDDGATVWELISTTWTDDTNWHTVKITRNSNNGWNMFLDGASKGTAIDGTYATSSYIGFRNAGAGTTDDQFMDDIKMNAIEYTVFYNYGSTTLDLTCWDISTSAGAPIYTIPSGNGTISAGGNLTFFVPIGDSIFTDAGDYILLRDGGDRGVDFMRYGTSAQSPPSNLLWTGSNPPAPTSQSEYLYRDSETVGSTYYGVDTGDGGDWMYVGIPEFPTAIIPSIVGIILVIGFVRMKRRRTALLANRKRVSG